MKLQWRRKFLYFKHQVDRATKLLTDISDRIVLSQQLDDLLTVRLTEKLQVAFSSSSLSTKLNAFTSCSDSPSIQPCRYAFTFLLSYRCNYGRYQLKDWISRSVLQVTTKAQVLYHKAYIIFFQDLDGLKGVNGIPSKPANLVYMQVFYFT